MTEGQTFHDRGTDLLSCCFTTDGEDQEFLATENKESTEDEESVVEGFSVFSGFVQSGAPGQDWLLY